MKKVLSILAVIVVGILGVAICASSAQGKKTSTMKTLFNLSYTPPTVAVTLNANGGTFSNGQVSNYAFNCNGIDIDLYGTTINNNKTIVMKLLNLNTYNKPTRTGYTFNYWEYNNQQVTNDSEIPFPSTNNLTLTAHWTVNTYTVTLDRQSGTGGSASVTATYGQDMPTATMPTRSGYTFGGYYDDTGGSGTQYYTATGSSARTWNKGSNTTLYANWIMKPNYFGDTYPYRFPDNTTKTYTWVESLGFYVEGGGTSITSGKRLAIGRYPQSYVGDSLNSSLETAKSNGTATTTGKSYKTSILASNNSSANQSYTTLTEYLYNGDRYARLSSAVAYSKNNGFKQHGGAKTISSGTTYWFKVEPIPVTVMSFNSTTNSSYKTVMADVALGGHRYNKTTGSNTLQWYKNPELRKFLNGGTINNVSVGFYGEALADATKVVQATIKNPNGNTYKTDSSSASYTTSDYVWVPSYAEMSTITDANKRKRQATDLAKATNAFASDQKNYVGNSNFWNRSPGSDTTVYQTDMVASKCADPPIRDYYAFCPCFALNV